MASLAPSSESNFLSPEEIGARYRVDGLLGRGGMAAVYRVYDRQLDRYVALKCPLTNGSDKHNARLTDMIGREYRTLAQLDHPSVITVYEYGVSAEGPYYTMELLEGSDLHQIAPVPWRAACAYLRDVASCLALLHSRRLVHRDVSPRNIRCHDDRAKLIDFGALAPMGPIKQIVGTPPLIAPEMLHRQELDGLCDLYALGGALYWALTQRHAYPARSLPELPQVWQHHPPPPSAFAADIPEALDALVLSLLSHEPEARPRNAAEVMEQLSTIAGLPDDESLHVSQSYLSTPSLQGREAEMARVRAAFGSAQRRSGLVWIEGEAGVGRSRFLGAALLEARLLGASVLHVAGSDVLPGDFAVVRELLERALEVLPQPKQGASSRELLSAFDAERGLPEEGRAKLVSRMRALLRRACAMGMVVVAIDDVDAADPASQALLASLRSNVRRNLLIMVTSSSTRALDSALATQRAGTEPLVLEPLTGAQTEALLGAVFGDVPGVHAVATRVHELSRGNPRATLELAQHLVATGKARYALGGWQLPAELRRAELPAAWTSAVDARLLALEPDARELAEVIALSHELAPTTTELDAITGHADRERREVALAALVAAGFVRLEAERAQLARGSDRERVIALVEAAQAQAIHARLARFLIARGSDPILVARCQLKAGEASAAIDTLLGELARGTRCETAPADYAGVLEQAIDAASALDRPRADRFQLTRELVKVGEHLGVADMPRRFGELLAQLRADSGLDAYEQLDPAVAPLDRLQQSYTAAQARYDALPARERVMSPLEAIQSIALVTRQAAAFGAVAMDYDLLESLPSLVPFVPLSDMLKTTVENTIPASAHLTAGRYERAREGYGVTLDRLLQSDHGGLDEVFWRWAVNALRFALGHLNAGLGVAEALRYAEELERDDTWLIAAWDVRRAFHLRQGDWREAEHCRDRIERLRVQSARRPPMVDTSARLELDTSAHAGDLVGVRRSMARLEGMVGLHPGYAVYAHYGPAVLEHLKGNHALALQHIDRALAMVHAGRHPTWAWIAGMRLEILFSLGRYQDAKIDGLTYMAMGTAAGLLVMLDHVMVPLALAEAKLGEHESALDRLDRAIHYREGMGSTGLNLGWAYEVRARVAIWMRDQVGYVRAAAACAREYGHGRGGSSFASKYEALRAEARQAGLASVSQLPPPAAPDSVASYLSTLSASTALEDRMSLALSLIVSSSGAQSGVLYRMNSRGGSRASMVLERCACSFDGPIPDQVVAWVSSVLATDLDDADETASETPDSQRSDGSGQWFPVAIGCRREGRYERTGAALLWFEAQVVPKGVNAELIEVIGHLLGS